MTAASSVVRDGSASFIALTGERAADRHPAPFTGHRRELTSMNFTDLSLPPELIAALAKQQYPTEPIQIAALPPLVAGKDAYLRAETVPERRWLIYCRSLCASIRASCDQIVIVAPTHELAIQIHRQSCELALNSARASARFCSSVVRQRPADRQAQDQAHVVWLARRIVELIERGKLKTRTFAPSSSMRRIAC